MRVKRKDLLKFYGIADKYFSLYGKCSIDEFGFINYFRHKYKLEKEK